jgi:hypothetical protein
MLTIVTWKWHRPGYRSVFTAEHVNAMARMVARHYPDPHRVLCVTEDPRGIDRSIEVIQDDKDFADIPSPHGGMNPACYRRLRMYRPDIAKWFGDRFVSLDLDTVATADLRPLWNRHEDIVLYRDPLYPTQYNGSMTLMSAGARPDVWTSFDPNRSPQIARGAGFRGSDQAWVSLRLPGEATWGPEHGVYSFRRDIEPAGGKLPANARLIVAHGVHDPWGPRMQALPWVREHWGTI